MLWAKQSFEDVVYLEARHTARQTVEQYIGVWRSVNDLRVQLGADLLYKFMQFVERKTAGLDADRDYSSDASLGRAPHISA